MSTSCETVCGKPFHILQRFETKICPRQCHKENCSKWWKHVEVLSFFMVSFYSFFISHWIKETGFLQFALKRLKFNGYGWFRPSEKSHPEETEKSFLLTCLFSRTSCVLAERLQRRPTVLRNGSGLCDLASIFEEKRKWRSSRDSAQIFNLVLPVFEIE